MSDETEVTNADDDDFWDKVGEDHDPVKFFTKMVKKCGAEIFVLPDGYIEIVGGCDNLVLHESENFREVFCGKCGAAVSVDDVKDLHGGSLLSAADIETLDNTNNGDDVADETSNPDDMDEFLSRVDDEDDEDETETEFG